MRPVRDATDADLAAIAQWLQEERRLTGEGFHCNLNVIIDAHGDGKLRVSGDLDQPVAFLANGLGRSGILETKPGNRGQGHAGALVADALERAYNMDEVCILDIECGPPTSAPFWQHMGFTVYGGDSDPYSNGKVYAWRELPRQFTLAQGSPVDLEIGCYWDPQQYGKDSVPSSSVRPAAVTTEDGRIKLGERVIFRAQYEVPRGRRPEPVARIIVGGREVYFGRARNTEAQMLGMCSDQNGTCYIDEIRL